MAKVMNILTTRGNSLSVMEEVLNSAVQRAGCHGVIVDGDVIPPSSRTCPRTSKRVIELRVLEVLRKASAPVEMGELVQELSRSLASEGERTLSPSSVRRWLIKLEGLGLVKRRVVMGGDGGTTSVASLALPSPPPHSSG
jgi:DNA-binding transcriptional ArsR family regulator